MGLAAARSPSPKDPVNRQCFQRLSVLLQCANAGLIVARAPPNALVLPSLQNGCVLSKGCDVSCNLLQVL